MSLRAPVLGLVLVSLGALGLGGWLRWRVSEEGERLRLAYRAPTDCVQAYRVQVDESFEIEGYGRFYNRAEEHSVGWLGLGRDDAGELRVVYESEDAGVRAADPRSESAGARDPVSTARGLYIDRTQIGPAAADASCRDRSWDPLEDALALGFPRLPTHPVAVGSSWRGARVSGDGSTCSAREICCNLGACTDLGDPKAAGGRDRSAPCVLPDWREQVEALPGMDPARELAIVGQWSDRAPGELGASASRRVRWEVGLQRVRSAEFRYVHPFLGVVREVRLEAIDRCESLEPAREAPEALARIEAAFEYKRPSGNPG